MPLTPNEAVDICKRHRLNLSDAVGLLGLADTPEDADRIAERFSAGPSSASVGADFAAALFGRDTANTEADETADPPTGRASTEGNNPSAVDNGELEMRKFTSDLFNQSN